MSFFPGKDPAAGDRYACDALETVVVPRSVDLDGFSVRRALPHSSRRTVGPFVFFDHFGPAEFKSGHGLDVRPHPHIGLSTLTYLYDGEIIHRDNLGVKAAIHPGAVNWMTAGRGIVHSERTAPDHRRDGEPLHGLQFWVGMPASKEEIDPSFAHLDGNELPHRERGGQDRPHRGRLAVRRALVARDDLRDAVRRRDARRPNAVMPLDAECEERGIYVVAGEIDVAGDTFGAGQLLVFRPTDRITLTGDAAFAHRGDRRRDARRSAPCLVELRLLAQGADRAGQERLARGQVRRRAGRRDRIHSASGEPAVHGRGLVRGESANGE